MSLLRKSITYFVCTYFGMLIFKYLTKKTPKILMYHRFSKYDNNQSVSINLFEKHLKLLSKDFNVLSLNKLIELYSCNQKVPDNTIVITIDDGYYDFYKFAYPLLNKYSIPATFFITTSFIDQTDWLWPDIVQFIINNTKVNNYVLKFNSDNHFTLENKNSWKFIINHLTELPNREKFEFINHLLTDTKIELPDKPPLEYSACTWDQIIEMSNNGIDIGSHTISHPILSKVENTNLLENEILNSKKIIEKKLKTKINSFCFPNGLIKDFNNQVKSIVKKSGYSCSVSATFNQNSNIDLFEIGRFSAGTNMKQFIKSTYGYELISLRLKNFINLN